MTQPDSKGLKRLPGQPEPAVSLKFELGTVLVINHSLDGIETIFPWLRWDSRSNCYRCHAYRYRELVQYLFQSKIPYLDSAANYNKLNLKIQSRLKPRQYQTEALEAWLKSKKGITVLPTGSGKSFLAALIMEKIQRSTLIIAPTIDLILQWQKILEEFFGSTIGLLGGGSYEIEDITVSTYDSARIHAEKLGNRFCLLVFDECHHLPAEANSEMARSYLAPYRLGLTATPETDMEKHLLLHPLVGRIVYTQQIEQLSGDYLAPYRVETIEVELTPKEREQYDHHRGIYLEYRDFIETRYGRPERWEKFVMLCYRTDEGRKAIQSFQKQRKIALTAEKKLEKLAGILTRHNKERILIFTNDNDTAYLISSLFLLPLITHETKAKERKLILGKFKDGSWPFLVNSRVLNEGVDVPEANVAVIISGTGTVREHVQRLGRILRKQQKKTAVLYEIITLDTSEVYTSKRRREHSAYDRYQ